MHENHEPNINFINKWVVAGVIAVLLAVFLLGWARVGYTRSVGSAQTDAERENFKHSEAYAETAASFLADSWKQYADAETDDDKAAIMAYVVMRYPNLDESAIENETLREFYRDCLTGGK